MIKGTVMQIGKDDPSGLVEILIQTTRDEIQRVGVNPLYRVVEISLPCTEDRKSKCKHCGRPEDEHMEGLYCGKKLVCYGSYRKHKQNLLTIDQITTYQPSADDPPKTWWGGNPNDPAPDPDTKDESPGPEVKPVPTFEEYETCARRARGETDFHGTFTTKPQDPLVSIKQQEARRIIKRQRIMSQIVEILSNSKNGKMTLHMISKVRNLSLQLKAEQ